MPTPVMMPQLGETVFEGTVARWLKQPGDPVQRQEPLLDITTDKIDTEVPAPAAGFLLKILAVEGATVQVGSVIAYIGDKEEEITEEAEGPERAVESSKETGLPVLSSSLSASRRAGDAASDAEPEGRSFVSPVVARLSAEHNIDLEEVQGSGRQGRVTKKDLLAYIEAAKRQPHTAPSAAAAAPGEDEVLQPFSNMRRAIAEHMSRSVRTSPHVVTIFEADMTAVVRHRAAHKEDLAQKGVTLSFTPYIVAAVAAALGENPTVNSSWTDAGLMLYQRIHVGIAVAVPDGLVVPVIRDTDEMNLQGLARAVNDLADRARRGELSPDEVRGGTFTVTNHGTSGSLLGTPIINQPQAAILGVGKICKRAVVNSGSGSDGTPADPLLPSADDTISIRPMSYLSLAFDHRILDGFGADSFLADVVKRLENWGA
ncbi:MAG: 2-oxo acid dehydrogenase subunit E2 [Caldilineaceae bacterium SB0670_bin_27]|uniref:Dihydrolipoamide acetyltransferase component of pyruvate dehydrogenase complex n=1 Tax=Caldilineaceae bacterium SB0664_bin_27 TaxID=2605260 RepID=A0A6B0YS57_9CHLR|nr:2-oxo acid dehydrogenase subunit E2 [Caldilineaceae bacterium SB0664_bin_27]MYJ79137.1 2-oxo acid dehydrogenase subunit E2 [Caldilineaceae bacterium SB0670_bin_27]